MVSERKERWQLWWDYFYTLEKTYGTVTRASEGEIKTLHALEPEETMGKLPEVYIEQGYKDWQDVYDSQIKAFISRGKVNNKAIREMIEETGTSHYTLGDKLGILNVSHKLRNNMQWQLADIIKISFEFGFLPEELIAKGEPLDKNIRVPQNWVDYENVELLVGDMKYSEFQRKIGGVKNDKLSKRTRFKLSELKRVGNLKFVMTKKGYEQLEEFLDEFRHE